MPDGRSLFHHHVFVDLETTGLDPSRDEVIEVGALFVEDCEPVRRISRLFRPEGPLPLAIRRLTGLSDEDLADQPPFGAFEDELAEALRGWTVVAHNAAFERSFLERLFDRIDAQVIDSCELLHYLYPEWESHSLESVARWAKVSDRAAHRALQDCEDTFGALCVTERIHGRLARLEEPVEQRYGARLTPRTMGVRLAENAEEDRSLSGEGCRRGRGMICNSP